MIDRRLMRELASYKKLFFTLISTSVILTVFIILQASYLTKIIEGVFLQGLGLNDVWSFMQILLAVMVLRSAFVWLNETLAHRLALGIQSSLRNRLVWQVLAVGPVQMRKERAGEIIHLLVEGVENIEPYFARFLPQLVVSALVPVIVLTVVTPIDLITGVLLLVTAPLIPLFMILIGKIADQFNKRQWETLSRLSAHFLDVLQGLVTLKIFGRSIEQAKVVARLSNEFRDVTLSVLKVAFLSALVLELVATISTALVAVGVGLRLLYFQLTFSDAFFLLLLAPEFYLPMRQLGSSFHAGMAGTSAAERIYEVLQMPAAKALPGAAPLVLQEAPVVAFRNVVYSYDNGVRPALAGFDLEIAAGEHVALVGASGAGKSTIASLLMGFIQAQQGVVTVNGMDLTQIECSAWLQHVAYVPQAAHLFSGTVADNIRLGRPEASLVEVEAAACAAGAHAFINCLADGYDTVVGEGGRQLSGGQKQRLAIARAFLKDAPLLILDEAAAGLDAYHEYELVQAVERLMQGRTVLTIAHRLSSIAQADRIVVVHQGRAAEQGCHQELFERQGLYYQLITAAQGSV